jgi:hypothetical protein
MRDRDNRASSFRSRNHGSLGDSSPNPSDRFRVLVPFPFVVILDLCAGLMIRAQKRNPQTIFHTPRQFDVFEAASNIRGFSL